METLIYYPKGTCSREMQIDYEGDKIVALRVIGGCNGNLKGIASLVKGKSFDEVIEALAGTTCGPKSTSCPDQLAKALLSLKK